MGQTDQGPSRVPGLDLTAKIIPIMVETVEKFAAIGAKPDHIVRFLQATIDEINSGKIG